MRGKNNNENHTVNIVIVNYNSYRYTIECLSSLLNSSYKNFKIFIVDNLSSDNSLIELEKWTKQKGLGCSIISSYKEEIEAYLKQQKDIFVTLIKNDKNLGFGAGNNTIIKPLSKIKPNEYVWMLNPDTEVESEVLNDLVNIAKGKDKTIIGNVIHYYKNKDRIMYCGGFKVKKYIHGVVDIKDEACIKDIDAIAGASLFTHLSTFLDIGFLPEEYFMYWEETDFCTKAKRGNYSFEVNLKSKVFDHVGATSKSNFLREYLYLLNGLRYHKKYNPKHMPFIVMSSIAKLIKSVIFEDRVKRNALYYAHIDFFKILAQKELNIKARLHDNIINAN